MAARTAPISREELERTGGGNLAKDAFTKPELRPVTVRGLSCLVKDYARRPLLLRETFGRLNISRESVVYEALRGAEGVPRYLGRIDAYAIVVERIDGTDLRAFGGEAPPAGFFDRLDRTVAGLHARGVVHADLRQRKNVLVGADGRPWIVDFASGLKLPPGSGLLRLAARFDHAGAAKLRARFAPETMTDSHRDRLSLDRFRPLRRRRLRRRARRQEVEAS